MILTSGIDLKFVCLNLKGWIAKIHPFKFLGK